MTKENILLWSHYADDHKGYCVEIDRQGLSEKFDSICHTDNNHLISYERVIYAEDIPIIKPSFEKPRERYEQIIFTKSSDWEYENEYRYYYLGRTKLARGLDKNLLTAVYLGCKMRDDDKGEIIDLVRTRFPNASIYQARKKLEQFGLDFDLIDD